MSAIVSTTVTTIPPPGVRPRAARSAAHPNQRRRRGAVRVGPALLRGQRRPQADPRRAADVAEAVAGPEAAAVIRAHDHDRAPAVRRALEVLDRDQLAAVRDGGAPGENVAAHPQ